MPTPTFVAAGTPGVAQGTIASPTAAVDISVSATPPSAAVVGDLLVAAVLFGADQLNNPGVGIGTIGMPSGWTLGPVEGVNAPAEAGGPGAGLLVTAWKVADAADLSASTTWTTLLTPSFVADECGWTGEAVIVAYSGVASYDVGSINLNQAGGN